MGVMIEYKGDKFEQAFLKAVSKEVEKSAMIFRRNLQTVLATTGKSPPASPKGSMIPYNRTGTLARSWTAGKTSKKGSKYVAKVGTNVKYAKYLVTRGGSGKRNYMHKGLAWKKKTLKMIKDRLSAKNLIKSAVRSLS